MEKLEKISTSALGHTKYIANSAFDFMKKNDYLIKMILYGTILVIALITSIVSFFKKTKLLNLVRVVLYCFIAIFLNYISYFLKLTLNKLSIQIDGVIELFNWIIAIILLILICINLVKKELQSKVIKDKHNNTITVEQTTHVSKIAGFFVFLFLISLMIIIISIDYFEIFKNIESDSVLIALLFIIICVCRLKNFEFFNVYIILILLSSLIIILIQFLQRNHVRKSLNKLN